MLTFQNNKLEFDVKFTDYKCVDFNKKDNGGETGLDNGDRVAGNMYSLNVYDLFLKNTIRISQFAHIQINIINFILKSNEIFLCSFLLKVREQNIGSYQYISGITSATIF